MHKTISLNLGGTVFHAEEPAFEILSQYLSAIRKNFRNEEGGEEIIQDIEARLAELFSERLQVSGTQALTEGIVHSVLSEMGKPEDFAESAEEETTRASSQSTYSPKPTRRLFRDPDDRLLGGVCGGLGAYVGVDPVWIRLLFAILFFGFGTGLFVYLLLWIIIPEAKTTTDKLQMRGDPVNLESINRFIRDEATIIQNKTNSGAVRSSVNKGADIMLRIFQALVKGALYGLAAASVAISLAIIIGLTIGLFSLVLASNIPAENPMHVLLSSNQILLGALTLFLLIGIPFFWLLYKGIAFLFKVPGPGMKSGYTLLLLWILGFVLAGITFTSVLNDYSEESVVRKEEKLPDSSLKKYIVKALPLETKRHHISFFGSGWSFHSKAESEGILSSDEVSLRLEKSKSGQFEIWQEISSRGSSESEATLLAARSRLSILQQDSVILIPSGIQLAENKWRNQRVEIIIKVPEGVQIDFDPSVRKLWERAEDNDFSWADRRSTQRCEAGATGISCTEVSTGTIDFTGDSKAFEFSDFTEVEGEEDVRISISVGKPWKVRVFGPDREEIQMERNGKRLIIISEEELDEDTRVVIEMPTLSALRLSGAAECEILDFSQGNLEYRLSGASHLSFKGVAKDILSEASGASQVLLNGSAVSITHEGSGASQLEADGLEVKQADLEVSGAAHAEIKVLETLNAKASGASSIEYAGNPARVKEQKTGAGRILAR